MPKTTRYAIDQELHKAIPYGALTKLAEHRGVSVESIARYYNPHNETYQSTFSRSLMELQIIAEVCPPWARAIGKVFNFFGGLWCGEGASEFNSDVETAATLAAKLANPQTPDADKMHLALELQRRANAIVAGLQFEDREDSGDKRLRQVG